MGQNYHIIEMFNVCKQFTSPYGDYDVVILLNGANDVKKFLKPHFLLQDEVTRDSAKLEGTNGRMEMKLQRNLMICRKHFLPDNY